MVVLTSRWPEEFLDGPDVVVVLQQMGGEGMAKGVTRGGLEDARRTDGVLHSSLKNGFSADDAGAAGQ
jgi:hypothetical protein